VTALLASVRSVDEALGAVAAGADIIDLKDPQAGALGALPPALIGEIVARVRSTSRAPLSATIGDLADGEIDEMLRRVQATGCTGVDFVKVGIAAGPHARLAVEALASIDQPVVPLFLADEGIDLGLVEAACAAGFPIVMVDTADKRAGSLFDRVALPALRRYLEITRGVETRAGLAGSLRADHVPALRELSPAIAGFRGALCDGTRTGTLVPAKVKALRAALPPLRASDLLIPAPRPA
jgi:uncharacterized protein (UPF0264 family)